MHTDTHTRTRTHASLTAHSPRHFELEMSLLCGIAPQQLLPDVHSQVHQELGPAVSSQPPDLEDPSVAFC